MSCTAWNSVFASADAPRPSAQPEHGVEHRDEDHQADRPGDVHPAHPDGEPDDDERLDRGEHGERQGVADDDVAAPDRQGHQPLERARTCAPAAWRRW